MNYFNKKTWKPSDCNGVITPLSGKPVSAKHVLPTRVLSPWYSVDIPSPDQGKIPCCAGEAAVDSIQMILRRFHYKGMDAIPKGMKLDGEAVWHKGRMDNYGDLDGGLLLEQAARAALELGALPPDTEIKKITGGIAELEVVLATHPVIEGTGTWPGWSDPDPRNGFVGEATDFGGGHATVIVAITNIDGVWMVVFKNSWGVTWGRYGYGCMSTGQWDNYQLDNPIYFETKSSVRDWSGYEKLLVPHKA